MNSQEWLKRLKTDQLNREGIGIYVLDTFNEEISELLSEHDTKLINQTIDNIINILSTSNIDKSLIEKIKEINK